MNSLLDGVKQVIAVSSGKGGVGKSTVSVNLAVALARQGSRVGLIDADVYGPNLPTMLGVTEAPVLKDVPGMGEVFVPPVAHGVKVMSMGFLIEGDQPAIWRGPMLHNLLTQFCHRVEWGELDFLIVDMPPGTGDVQLSMAQLVRLNGAVLVTTPQEVSVQDVKKAWHMFDKVQVPVLGIVENMSYFDCGSCSTRHRLFGQGGANHLARKFSAEVLAELPILSEVREGGDIGRPAAASADLEIAGRFAQLATRVRERLSAHDTIVQIGRFE